MIHVIATLKVDPARRSELLAAFAELTPEVLAEDGCIEYGAAVDTPTPLDVQQAVGDDAVVVVEKWESVAALEAHLAAPHMAAFREKTADLVKGLSLMALEPA